jgi:hypothetical protein
MARVSKVGSTGQELDPITAEAIRKATKNNSLYHVSMTKEEWKGILNKGTRVIAFDDEKETVILITIQEDEGKEAKK